MNTLPDTTKSELLKIESCGSSNTGALPSVLSKHFSVGNGIEPIDPSRLSGTVKGDSKAADSSITSNYPRNSDSSQVIVEAGTSRILTSPPLNSATRIISTPVASPSNSSELDVIGSSQLYIPSKSPASQGSVDRSSVNSIASSVPSTPIPFNGLKRFHCRHESEFRRGEEIGAGQYGVVNLATDPASKEMVVLKMVKEQPPKNEELNKGFPLTSLREIKLLGSLHHKNIVRLREVVTTIGCSNDIHGSTAGTSPSVANSSLTHGNTNSSGSAMNISMSGLCRCHTNAAIVANMLGTADNKSNNPSSQQNAVTAQNLNNNISSSNLSSAKSLNNVFLSMEFCDGDLTGLLLHPEFSRTQSLVKYYLHQILSGLSYMHSHGVCHRDMKPPNILVAGKHILKIADFGLAKRWKEGLKMTTKVVSPWYRAPELFLGDLYSSVAIDVWSVGIIFIELMEGVSPFSSLTDMETIKEIWSLCGTPTAENWPEAAGFDNYRMYVTKEKQCSIEERYGKHFSKEGMDLLKKLLTLNPKRRITAKEALEHEYFKDIDQISVDSLPPLPARFHESAVRTIRKFKNIPNGFHEVVMSDEKYRAMKAPTVTVNNASNQNDHGNPNSKALTTPPGKSPLLSSTIPESLEFVRANKRPRADSDLNGLNGFSLSALSSNSDNHIDSPEPQDRKRLKDVQTVTATMSSASGSSSSAAPSENISLNQNVASSEVVNNSASNGSFLPLSTSSGSSVESSHAGIDLSDTATPTITVATSSGLPPPSAGQSSSSRSLAQSSATPAIATGPKLAMPGVKLAGLSLPKSGVFGRPVLPSARLALAVPKSTLPITPTPVVISKSVSPTISVSPSDSSDHYDGL